MALDQVLAHLVENLNAQMGDDGKSGDKEENNFWLVEVKLNLMNKIKSSKDKTL